MSHVTDSAPVRRCKYLNEFIAIYISLALDDCTVKTIQLQFKQVMLHLHLYLHYVHFIDPSYSSYGVGYETYMIPHQLCHTETHAKIARRK